MLDDYMHVLSEYGIPVRPVNTDKLHYLTSAQRVCERIQGRSDQVGILICGTGMGMSIAANKFRGVYAARCLTVEDAEMSRVVNNANVLCIAVRTGLEANEKIIHTFMNTPFTGRKLDELEYIECLELETHPAPKAAKSVVARAAARTA